MNDKFRLLRDDRSVIFGRLDHTDNELENYRKDIRALHDQISKSVLKQVHETNARTLETDLKVSELIAVSEKLQRKFHLMIETDFRESAIE